MFWPWPECKPEADDNAFLVVMVGPDGGRGSGGSNGESLTGGYFANAITTSVP